MVRDLAEVMLAEEAFPPDAGDRDVDMAFKLAERMLLRRIARTESEESERFHRARLLALRERRRLWEQGS